KELAKEIFELLINTYPQLTIAEDYFHLAALLSEATDLTRILKLQLIGLKKDPVSLIGLHHMIGTAIKHNEHGLAIQAIEKILLIPGFENMYMLIGNLAVCLFDMGFLDQAVHFYAKALSIKDDKTVSASYGMALLANGQYEQGWDKYRSRTSMKAVGYDNHKFTGKLWQGQSLNKKTIIIAHEQGMGDSIQFVRFISLLKQRYQVKIYLKCQSALFTLFQQLDTVSGIFTNKDPTPKHD
ncbi:MAG: hypothetical protein ACK4PR_04275, partial [Gammaproteobacteria bacterium]